MSNLTLLGKRIKDRRLELSLTQDELAKLTGYTSRSSINKIELGLVDLPQSKIEALARALKTLPTALMGWGELNSSTPFVDTELRPITLKQFPLLGEIACGKPIYANESHETYIDASSDIKADFCLIAKGDSMVGARIHDGDVVFIKEQPLVENGQIAAVIINNEVTLKRWYFYAEKQKLVLNPENTAYEPLVYIGEELNDIRCIGRAICFMSNL